MTTPAVRPAPVPAAPGPQGPTRGLILSGATVRFAELLQQRRPPPPDTSGSEALAGMEDGVACRHEAFPSPDDDAALDGEEMEANADTMGGAQDAPPVAPPAACALAAASPEASCRDAMREVALTIAGFCNDRAVNNGELWQVRMSLRADVVPATTLHLGLSPHWLTLRFEVGDPAALDLLSRGREALLQVLENTMARRRDISITFESP